MRTTWLGLGMVVLTGGVATVAGACSSSSGGGTTASADGGGDAVASTALAVACNDSIDSIYGDPGPLGDTKGAILKCAHDRDWAKADLEAYVRADTYAYTGKPFTSGAKIYRVVYRTERGTQPATPGYTSALLLVPDTPLAGAPAVVVSHGTAGQAARCSPSKDAFTSMDDSFAVMIFSLVGAGYPTIVPDYAGYSNYGAAGNPPSGYALSDDVGKSVLDGLRAIRVAAPSLVSDKSVIVGHSQGGHTALSALAMAESYGVPIAATAVYSPLWFNEATWGALLFVANQYPIADNAFSVGVSVWYHYSHGEVLDGQGHGVDVFATDKRAAIKQFFDDACVGDTDRLKALGTLATDLYDPAFANSVKGSAALGSDCGGDPVCDKWMARYAADRPHLAGAAKNVPLLVLYGTNDATIPPDRAMCGFDRLKADGANFKVCLEPGATHSGVVGARAGYVADWIASQVLGAPPPPACAQDETALKDDAGTQVACATPPPND